MFQKEKMDKERRDQIEKQRNNEKKWDYWVRASHVEEIPFRKQFNEDWRRMDEEEYTDLEKLHVQNAMLAAFYIMHAEAKPFCLCMLSRALFSEMNGLKIFGIRFRQKRFYALCNITSPTINNNCTDENM